MNQPSVFISCVSPEFLQTRSRVATILIRLGYTPVTQEIFGTEAGDLRQVLRDKIDSCDGLIQIIGKGYGAEPPTVEAEYGRVSYTQFEFLYAKARKKKTWLLIAGDTCLRDTPIERLDLPRDPAHTDPAGYQEERRALQLAYRHERQKDGHLRHHATSDAELDLKVERLRDELAELRGAFKIWQNKVLCAFALGFLLLSLIAGSIWWFGYIQHRDIENIGKEARHITKEKIRTQLLESVERTHQAALNQADKAADWKERELLRAAAEKTYVGSVSRVDELANSFTEIEGTERSSDIFNEMTRILAREGVDQAVAYVASRSSGILEKVKARAAVVREKNRADLLPLLKSAQLQANRNQPDQAERLFTDILALEPEWSEARNSFAWVLVQRGDVTDPTQGNAKLQKAIQICRGTLAFNQKETAPQDWSVAQRILGDSLQELGTRSGAEEGRKLLEEAISSYHSALEVKSKVDPSRIWAKTQNNLGGALLELGSRSGAKEGRQLLEEAVAAYHSALEVTSKADQPQDWAQIQNNLGGPLVELGTRSGAKEGRQLLQEAVTAYRSALEVFNPADKPQYWAKTQNNLGLVLEKLGTRSEGDESRQLLQEAIAAYRSALEIFHEAEAPQYWAMAENNLGVALTDLGSRSGDGLKLLEEAVAALHSALQVRTKAVLPQYWAMTQNNLGLALAEMGRRAGPDEGRERLEEAVADFRSALEIYTNADLPPFWAQTQNNMGLALMTLASRSAPDQDRIRFQEAVAAFRAALQVYLATDTSPFWAQTEYNLGSALEELGSRGPPEEGCQKLEEGVTVYRSIVAVITGTDLPRYRLAAALNRLGFILVLSGQFAEAQNRCVEAQKLAEALGDGITKANRDNLILLIQGNLAHSLLFQGHYDDALSIYQRNWVKPLEGKTFGQITLDDFAAFEKAHLTHPDLPRMKRALADRRSDAPTS